jgi:trk system potassium uptake protein TrkH
MSKTVAAAISSVRDASRSRSIVLATCVYGILCLAGAVLLYLPISRDAGREADIQFIDALFIATSAVSTTGLVTIDPASSFSFFGELVILVLLQIGGIGYLTVMTFLLLTWRDRLNAQQLELTRAGFGLTADYTIGRFVRVVAISTLAVEAAGALLLWRQFESAGVPDALWQGIFHSVSAFCTAGFSLFATSLEGFKDNGPLLLTISVLSYIGAIGFIVIFEAVDRVTRRRSSFSPTSRIILSVTGGIGLTGTVFLMLFEPSIHALPRDQQLLNAFFQAMTASTTVGFNSLPIGALAPASIMVLYLLMFVGASPSGTGGGLKSTTAALIVASVWASLTNRASVVTGGVRVPEARVRQANATLVMGLATVFVAVVLLDLTGSYPMDKVLFEVFSALGTVGLSMGLTGELNDAGKFIITVVMYVGRVGILAFFVLFALNWLREAPSALPQRDVVL